MREFLSIAPTFSGIVIYFLFYLCIDLIYDIHQLYFDTSRSHPLCYLYFDHGTRGASSSSPPNKQCMLYIWILFSLLQQVPYT